MLRRIGSSPVMSQAVATGPFVFVSGQVALDPDGALVGAGDVRAQAEQCFRNIEALVAEAGGTMADVTKITGFLTDAAAAPAYLAVREAMFGTIGAPASSTVVVAALLDPRFLVEIEAVAVVERAGESA
jgi:enamine deaminase RidA (YjgF/YER057c/UK114 family)